MRTASFCAPAVWIALAVASVGCSAPAPTTNAKTKMNALTSDSQDLGNLKLNPRPIVSAETLNSDDMVLSGLGVGIASQYSGSIISVNYSMPKLADFAQIIRCRADAALDNLWDLDIGTANRKTVWAAFLTKDYWQLASQNYQCQLATEGFSKQGAATYLDITALSGDYRYIARACVNKERFSGKVPESGFPCSSWVAVAATPINGYVNRKSAIAQAADRMARERRDKIDALARRVVLLTEIAALEQEKCDQSNVEAEKRKARNEAMSDIIGSGIEAGLMLVQQIDAEFGKSGSDSATNPTNAENPSSAANPSGSLTLALADKRELKNSNGFNLNFQNIAVSGAELAKSINLLFTKPTDFAVDKCPAQIKAMEEGNITKLELDAASKAYGDSVKAQVNGEGEKK